MTQLSTEIRATTAKLVRLPRTFAERGDVSILVLLAESGYAEHHIDIVPEVIREALLDEPDCVDAWMTYSEDKRAAAGWYCRETQGGRFEVGYFGQTTNDDHCARVEYLDRVDACANFIKNESEDLRRI